MAIDEIPYYTWPEEPWACPNPYGMCDKISVWWQINKTRISARCQTKHQSRCMHWSSTLALIDWPVFCQKGAIVFLYADEKERKQERNKLMCVIDARNGHESIRQDDVTYWNSQSYLRFLTVDTERDVFIEHFGRLGIENQRLHQMFVACKMAKSDAVTQLMVRNRNERDCILQ